MLCSVKTFFRVGYPGWVIKTQAKWIDCEQFLSFPSIFLAVLRASVELSSSDRRNAFLRASVSFSNLHNFNCVLRAEDFRNQNRLLVVYKMECLNRKQT